jgi:catechol 2,3-dioxygenase-like lactoylglutathione lyase family enzyme
VITHIRFLVDDLARDVAFYRDVMLLKQVVDVPGIYAELDAGAVRLAFYRRDLMSEVLGEACGTRGGNDLVLALRVRSVDEEAARLAAKGVLLTRPPHDQAAWRQRVAHLRDASGRLVELWSPTLAARAAALPPEGAQ